MVEVSAAADLKRQIRKLNKRLLKLRESESALMTIVYGGCELYGRVLWETRDSISSISNTLEMLNVTLESLENP